MSIKRSELIQEVTLLTRQIDALAEDNDWMAMHDLVEQRMNCLNRVFDSMFGQSVDNLADADCEKLAAIAESNERILRQAKARQKEIISFASTQRTVSKARQAYAANAQ